MDEINSLERISGIMKKRPNKEQSSGIPAKRLKMSSNDTFEFLSPSTLQSPKKIRGSPDDTCSIASSTISQRLAYGGRRYSDDLDSDDESVLTTTRGVNIQLIGYFYHFCILYYFFLFSSR